LTEPKEIELFAQGSDGKRESLSENKRKGPIKIKKVCAAYYHTVAVSVEGEVFAWGDDGRAIDKFYFESLGMACVGLIGQGGEMPDVHELAKNRNRPDKRYWFPTPVVGQLANQKVTDISAGFAHSAVVTEDGKLYTWGFGYFSVLGHGKGIGKVEPTEVRFPGAIEAVISREVVCGLIHTVVLDDKGRVYTFGMGGHSQLGHGDTKWKHEPKMVEQLEGLGVVKTISAGTYQTAVVLENGQVHLCGSYLLGALGLGDVHRPQMNFRINGSLLGRENNKVACGNHFIAAF